MTVFGAHHGKDSPGNTSRITQNIVLVVAGLAAFYLSFRYVIPNDLFTSALFFDALELQPVFSQPAGLFAAGGIWQDLPDVTQEALVFALSLLAIQILVGYRAATSGGYTPNSPNIMSLFINMINGKDKIGRANLNWAKVGWMGFYWAISLLDTYTDTEFRSNFGANGGVLRALIVSFFFYNLASEWMLMVGFKTTIDYGMRAIGDLKDVTSRAKFGGQMSHQIPQGGRPQQNQRKKKR